MEKLLNRIMNVSVVILSLSGVIACSEIEALKPKSAGSATFAGQPKTVCALDPELLQVSFSHILTIQSEKPVTLQRSTQPLLQPYGVDLSCFFDEFMGPVYERVTAKFKISDFATKEMDFLLSISLPDVAKTYYFDSSNALSQSLKKATTTVGDLDGTFNPATASVGTELYAEFDYAHHGILLTLTKVDAMLNIWRATIVIEDKSLDSDVESPMNYYELGSFDVSLDSAQGI